MMVPSDKIVEVEQKYFGLQDSEKVCLRCRSLLPDEVRDAWFRDPKHAWLYVQCANCGYQNPLWIIFKRAGVDYKEVEK